VHPSDDELLEHARRQAGQPLVSALRSAWQAGYRAATGRRATPGRPPFRDSPEGAAALARIAQLRATGLSYPAIARKLDAEHVPSAAGGPWRASMVHALYQQTKTENRTNG